MRWPVQRRSRRIMHAHGLPERAVIAHSRCEAALTLTAFPLQRIAVREAVPAPHGGSTTLSETCCARPQEAKMGFVRLGPAAE